MQLRFAVVSLLCGLLHFQNYSEDFSTKYHADVGDLSSTTVNKSFGVSRIFQHGETTNLSNTPSCDNDVLLGHTYIVNVSKKEQTLVLDKTIYNTVHSSSRIDVTNGSKVNLTHNATFEQSTDNYKSNKVYTGLNITSDNASSIFKSNSNSFNFGGSDNIYVIIARKYDKLDKFINDDMEPFNIEYDWNDDTNHLPTFHGFHLNAFSGIEKIKTGFYLKEIISIMIPDILHDEFISKMVDLVLAMEKRRNPTTDMVMVKLNSAFQNLLQIISNEKLNKQFIYTVVAVTILVVFTVCLAGVFILRKYLFKERLETKQRNNEYESLQMTYVTQMYNSYVAWQQWCWHVRTMDSISKQFYIQNLHASNIRNRSLIIIEKRRQT